MQTIDAPHYVSDSIASKSQSSSPAPTIVESDQYPEIVSIEKGTTEDIDSPPDGGLQAWVTVLGCSLVSFSTFGFVPIPLKQCGLINSSYPRRIVNTFGAFRDFYSANYLSGSSPVLVSMVGSIGVFVLYVCTWSRVVFFCSNP